MENLASEAGNFYSLDSSSRDRASGENSAESDFSGGEREDLPAKKDTKLGVKRKEKDKDWDKDKKKDKDKGYAALEGESSPDEADMDVKSPFKGKKRSFKFSSAKKEKKKDEEKDKDKKKEKEKDKKEKVKEPEILAQAVSLDDSKLEKKKEKKEKDKEKKDKSKEEGKGKDAKKVKSKEKKKSKSEETGEDEFPIFGVALEVAVERCKCHDNVSLPLVVRDCIDFIEEHGLSCEGIYRSSGVKTRVLELRRAYNLRENVCLDNEEPPTVASLLKQYLRELPENILTDQLLPKFEEAASLKNPSQQEQILRDLIDQLPRCNRDLLAWLFTHMTHVVERERVNKMNVQNVSIVLSPTLNLSHRILSALFGHASRLFPKTSLHKYIPPISGVSVQLPTDPKVMEAELKKQESLLTELHREITQGSSSKTREEQLWEAQRIVTQLKRKMKTHGRSTTKNEEELKLDLAVPPPQVDEEPATVHEEADSRKEAGEIPEEAKETEEPAETPSQDKEDEAEKVIENEEAATEPVENVDDSPIQLSTTEEPVLAKAVEKPSASSSSDEGFEGTGRGTPVDELRLMLEIEERENLIAFLEDRIKKEREMIDELHEQLAETGPLKLSDSSDDEDDGHHYSHLSEEEQEQLLADILRENRELEEKNTELFCKIEEQREACVHLRVQIQLLERG